jgi:hypothetical protein
MPGFCHTGFVLRLVEGMRPLHGFVPNANESPPHSGKQDERE